MAGHVEASTRPSPWKSDVERHYDKFLEQLSVKGRATIQKHDELCEADAAQGSGELWKRLAGGLGQLAGHATEMLGQQSVKFHIADGKYKQQVFALEDTKTGTIVLYLPDVTGLATERKILAPGSLPRSYKIVGTDLLLQLELINAETRDMTVCKAMVGWGRRALRVDLNVQAKEKQIRAVEMLCELAAETWVAAPAAAAAAATPATPA